MRPALVLLGLSTLLTTALPAQGPAPRPPTISELEAIARRDSNDAGAHYELALGYWDKKRWDDAERALHQAIVVSPSFSEAYLALSQLPQKRGEGYWKSRVKKEGKDSVQQLFRQAERDYRHAFLLNPLVDLQVLSKVDLPERAQFFSMNGMTLVMIPPWYSHDLEKTINAFYAADYVKATAQMQKIANDQRFGNSEGNMPDEVLWYKGLLAAHQADFEPAVQAFAVMTRRNMMSEQDTSRRVSGMRSNDYRYFLATMLYLQGRFNQAIPTFQRTLELDLGLYVAHVQLARMYESMRLLPQALTERQRALDLDPENPDLLVDQAGTMLQAGQADSALAPLAEAARLNPRDPRVPYLQGVIASQLHRTALADSAFARFLAIAPSRFAAQIDEVRRRQPGP